MPKSAILLPALLLVLAGCAQHGPDEANDAAWDGAAAVWTAVDAPAGLVGSTIASSSNSADHSPVPGNGSFGDYWGHRIDGHFRHFDHIGNHWKYYFWNANSEQPPYEYWWPTTIERDKTTWHETFDNHLFLFNWDDPYVN